MEYRPVAYIECSAENSEEMTKMFKSYNYKLFTLDENGEEHDVNNFAFNTIVKPIEQCEQGAAD